MLEQITAILEKPISQSFRGRDFLTLRDFTPEELWHILETALIMKKEPRSSLLKGRTLGMIFCKSSTRTRVSFEAGILHLGGAPLYLNKQDIQLGRGETIADTARVLSRYLDGIMIRTHSHSEVEELGYWSTIPVINGLTDLFHPCQAMADYLTVYEHLGRIKGLKIAFIGDGNNVANSLMLGAAKFGADFVLACPKEYEPSEQVLQWTEEIAAQTGSSIEVVHDPKAAASGAHVLYTDVWTSMGQEAEQEKRIKDFAGYQINGKLLELADHNCIVMHCLPARRGEEISEDVLEGPKSKVFDEAENRLHVQKAIMALIMQTENPVC